jgi:hypothetical protein
MRVSASTQAEAKVDRLRPFDTAVRTFDPTDRIRKQSVWEDRGPTAPIKEEP